MFNGVGRSVARVVTTATGAAATGIVVPAIVREGSREGSPFQVVEIPVDSPTAEVGLGSRPPSDAVIPMPSVLLRTVPFIPILPLDRLPSAHPSPYAAAAALAMDESSTSASTSAERSDLSASEDVQLFSAVPLSARSTASTRAENARLRAELAAALRAGSADPTAAVQAEQRAAAQIASIAVHLDMPPPPPSTSGGFMEYLKQFINFCMEYPILAGIGAVDTVATVGTVVVYRAAIVSAAVTAVQYVLGLFQDLFSSISDYIQNGMVGASTFLYSGGKTV